MALMLRIGSLVLLLALAACGGAGQWSKPETTRGKAAQDLSECRHVAEIANRRDSDSDTDSLASRGQGWERVGVYTTHRAEFADRQRARQRGIATARRVAQG